MSLDQIIWAWMVFLGVPIIFGCLFGLFFWCFRNWPGLFADQIIKAHRKIQQEEREEKKQEEQG